MSVIETEKLTKYYGKSKGIENVDLKVEAGEIFGFIGPNGAGKSTTIRTLLGLIRPTSGRAEIFGKSCVEHPEIRAEVGYLPAEVFYYDRMRVGELLRYSASFYKKDCTARIRELSGALNLDLNRRIDDLSFGNRKKVGIVQALLHEPKLLILDEPTGGLDPLMQQTFFQLVAEENRKGTTVFFSSHILSEVQKMCARVAFIKEGRIIRVESMSELQSASWRHFRLETKEPGKEADFQMPGVRSLAIHGGEVGFLYRGDVNALLRRLADIPLRGIAVEEPSLEEIFLQDYGREG